MRLKHMTPEQAAVTGRHYLAQLEAARLQAELKQVADEAHDAVGGGVTGIMRAIEAAEEHLVKLLQSHLPEPAPDDQGRKEG
jgi:hypothetical protein